MENLNELTLGSQPLLGNISKNFLFVSVSASKEAALAYKVVRPGKRILHYRSRASHVMAASTCSSRGASTYKRRERGFIEWSRMIISVINQKGGVGKTTTVVNLGAALARAGQRVLLLDLDPQESLLKFTALDEANARILRAQARQLPQVLERESYDLALIDCPPVLGREAAAALKVSHLALAPTPPRYLDVAGFSLLRQTVAEASARGNPKLQLKILVTMRDARLSLHHEYEARLREAFASDVCRTAIPRAGVFDKAADANTSVYKVERRSQGAKAFAELATEVLSQAQSYAKKNQ
jgi:chromosome partitioning protein